MKLSKRLKQIAQMVPADYHHIWDCCCDHGFLGTHLLSERCAENIHFVDNIPKLIESLDSKLKQFYPNSISNWETHCLDVAELPIEKYDGKQLIIIAGIGGDLMTRLIGAIQEKNHVIDKEIEIDYLLCPVHRQFALRQKLIELDFNLKDEILIEDKKRFYEIMFVTTSNNRSESVSPIGDKIWQAETEEQLDITKQYLHKTLNYYQRRQRGNSNNVDYIIDAYRAIKL